MSKSHLSHITEDIYQIMYAADKKHKSIHISNWPTVEKLDALIYGCGPKTSTFLQFLKETGARPGEAHLLKWTDIDYEAETVRIT